ncbi:NADPH:quinone oxidoreductase family protein [Nonomuraea fuscirosea]|uniref:NADPH:quinone oxidoreductase family protein n=1 Tax=Nonomuraea fuscirosea TaxID=1291556 RepID=UPI0033FF2379
MRKVQFAEFGGPEQLSGVAAESPPVAPGQVRIKVHAVGVNFAELVQLSGNFQISVDLPAVPGFELSGTVTELGEGVDGLSLGERVVALVCWGAYADEVVVDAVTVAGLPDGADLDTAAAFPVAFGTAFMCLHHRAQVNANDVVVVSGANGNVGHAAVQVARQMGAVQVIAVTRDGTETMAHADAVLASTDRLAAQIADLTRGHGADVILDLVGGAVFPQLLEAVAWEGRVVTAGYASGNIPNISLLDVLIRNIAVLGEDIAAYTVRDPHRVGDALRTCVGWWRQGAVEPRPPVTTMPLEDAAKALSMVAQASAGGKIVLSANSL